MENDSVPDLTEYSNEELLDLYINLDKDSNKEHAKALEERIQHKLNSTPPAENSILQFLKRNKGILIIVILAAVYFFIIRWYFSVPGNMPSSRNVLIPVLIHGFIIIFLGYYASKGKLIAGLLIVLYFLFMMFGRMLF